MWPDTYMNISEKFMHFYSHIPCGMWPFQLAALFLLTIFLLTHPVWDVTSKYSDYGGYSYRFLLTHPVWDVTRTTNFSSGRQHFYSHIPCGMWPGYGDTVSKPFKFLLTHPVWDVTTSNCIFSSMWLFLLTHPVWDVTALPDACKQDIKISTHTSRVGCDTPPPWSWYHTVHFYSHIPCGMWLTCRYTTAQSTGFLLTHPVWDVTCLYGWAAEQGFNFYSHIPCGMWPLYIVYFNHIIPIYYRMDL